MKASKGPDLLVGAGFRFEIGLTLRSVAPELAGEPLWVRSYACVCVTERGNERV
jgi:hypothetical protein